MADTIISETLTSATTSAIGKPKSNKTPFGQRFLNFAISGLTDSTVEIQTSIDDGKTFVSTESFAAVDATKVILHASPGIQYRFEVTTYGGAGDSILVLLLN